jgi:RNA polymerase sigma-70 factor (ECF subfamily)
MASNSDSDRNATALAAIQGIVRRDADAFAGFYDCYAATVVAFLCKMFSDRAEAEDVLQETFWQVWRQACTYDASRGSPVAWLIQIARSRGIDRLRQLRLKAQRDAGPLEDWHEKISTQPTAEAAMIQRDTDQAVHHEMDKLPDDQREAIMLAFFNGLTHQEISRRLVTPLGTIKTRIRLGVQKLHMAFKGQDYAND